MGPNYARPKLDVPTAFRDSNSLDGNAAKALADLPWWEVFNDAGLRALIGEGLEHNLNLDAALARVLQYRELAQGSGAAFFPTLETPAQAQYGHGFLTLSQANATARTLPWGSLGVRSSWEIDVWGRLRRGQEAAVAQYLATDEARRGVIMSLVADIAMGYIRLQQLDEQRRITQETIANYTRTLELYTARLDGGAGNRLPVDTGRAQVQEAQATVLDIERQTVAQENALSLLLARAPGPVPRSVDHMTGTCNIDVPAGLPSALLERRPDIRQAEQVLIMANAQVGVAKANFFPQLSLTALAGTVSTDLSRLFARERDVWSLGVQTSWLTPLLQGAQLRHVHKAARFAFEGAVASYKQTVLAALTDVATALNDTQRLRGVIGAREQQVAALTEALDIATERYRGGVTSYLEVTVTQNALLPARLSLAAIRGQERSALVSLYKALGGGWQHAKTAAEAPEPASQTH